MSTAGKFKVITAPNDVFLETDVGDFAIYSTNGVFVGALPAGVVGKAHMKFDEEGVVANEPISALAGVSGDVRTGSIVPIMSAAGIQIDSGLGTIRLDSVVVDNDHVTCDDLTTVTVTGASNVTTVQLTLPTATLTCPTGMTAVRLAPASPLLDVQNTDGSGSTLRVQNITVNNITTADSAALHIADSLLVDADIEVGTTMRVHGASVLDSTLRVDGATLTLGNGSSSSIIVSAPYLGISALTQVPFLRFDSGTVLDNNTWGVRNAARATFGGFPAFFEANGMILKDILTGPAAGLTSAMCVRNLNGAVTTVFVENGLMTTHAPTVAGPSTLVDATGTKTATTFVNTRNDKECSVQVAAPSYRLLSSPATLANEVLLTAPAAGLTVDKRVIAPMYRVAAEADLTPIAGGGTEFSTKINVPQILLRNAGNATTVATHQTDSDGSARIVAPTLRLAGNMEVQLRPTAGGTQITPGVLDLSYNTALASIAYLRVMADEAGLRLYTPRLFFEGTASSLISSVSTGTLTMSNLPTLSLNGICTITATTALSKTKTSIVADTLELGTTIKKTVTPEAGGILLGPEADFTLRSATRLALQSATSVDFVMRKQTTATSTDTTYTTFKFQAGSKGELRLNGRDIGLTPYDALAGAVSSSVPDGNGWYTYRDSAGVDLFRSRRYDNGRPFLLSTDAPTTLVPSPVNSFVIPGFVNSLFNGVATTSYAFGSLNFQGAWVDITIISQAGAGAALSLRHLQTVLLNSNQTDRRPAVWRLFARESETSSVVNDWKLVMQGGTSEITYPTDRELPVYAAYRLAVSIVTSGDEVRLSALNMWGVNAALTSPAPQSSFTGQHYTVPASGADASEFRPGMVVVSSGEHDSINKGGYKARGGVSSIRSDAALPRVVLTDQSADRRVFGVVDSWRNNEWVNYVDKRLLVNSLGEGAVLVCSKNGPIRNGDLLQTSSVRGYAERQDSEFVASYTVGKATMDCDFEPRLVPKMRVVVDERGVPALDTDGLVIWEPTGETEREYDTLRMASQGVTVAMISCVYFSG